MIQKLYFLGIALLLSISLIHSEYISHFGNKVIKTSDFIVKGTPVKISKLSKGGSYIIHFRVDSVLKGKMQVAKIIYLIYMISPSFEKGEQWVVFLRALSSGNAFEVKGDFSLKAKESIVKVESLKKLIFLEVIPDKVKKQKAYIKYCLDGLLSKETWLRFHAFREWNYFFDANKTTLKFDILQKLKKIYPHIIEFSLKQKIKRDIIYLKRSLVKGDTRAKSPSHISLLKKIKLAQDTLVTSDDEKEKIKALHFLAFFPSIKNIDIMHGTLEDHSIHVRSLASFYIGIYGNNTSIPFLMKVLRKEKNLRVCKNIIFALGQLEAIEAKKLIKKFLVFAYTQKIAKKVIKQLSSIQGS